MIADIFGPDFLVLLFIVCVYVIPLCALINAISKPSDAFTVAGFSKPKWISSIVILTLLGSIIGTLIAIRYLSYERPRINRAHSDGLLLPITPQPDHASQLHDAPSKDPKRGTRRRTRSAIIVLAALVIIGLGVVIVQHNSSTPGVMSVVTDCPKPLGGKVLAEWCLAGTANDLPFKMAIYTLKLEPPFITAKGGTEVSGKHLVGSGCDLGATSGSLVVPVFYTMDQNVETGPTGGVSPVVYDVSTLGTFYTNPEGSNSNIANTNTEVVVDSNLVSGWKCGTKSFVGFGNKTKSKDTFGYIGFFVLSGWNQYPWKSYMLRHLTMDIAVNPPTFFPASHTLYRGDAIGGIISRIDQIDGPRVTITGKGGSKRIVIQLLDSSFRTMSVKKSVG
jgi:hypothetical protein